MLPQPPPPPSRCHRRSVASPAAARLRRRRALFRTHVVTCAFCAFTYCVLEHSHRARAKTQFSQPLTASPAPSVIPSQLAPYAIYYTRERKSGFRQTKISSFGGWGCRELGCSGRFLTPTDRSRAQKGPNFFRRRWRRITAVQRRLKPLTPDERFSFPTAKNPCSLLLLGPFVDVPKKKRDLHLLCAIFVITLCHFCYYDGPFLWQKGKRRRGDRGSFTAVADPRSVTLLLD